MAEAKVVISGMSDTRLALALTVRHDGRGGVADDLDTPTGLTRWVREHHGALGGAPLERARAAGEEDLAAARSLRAAVRALFAHAVRPGEPSPADAGRLLPVEEALRRLDAAAAAVPTAASLQWPEGGGPVAGEPPAGRSVAAGDSLTAGLARA